MGTRLFEPGTKDVLYLVDLSGYVFRAYHAIAPLTSPSGEPTNAVFGTVNMLERLIRQCRPARLAVAMDSRTPTFRKETYPEYKANRPPPPDDLKQQMGRVREVIEAFPIPIFQRDGFEADDVIATLVKHCIAASIRVVIVSADKDLMQLVGPNVMLWDTMRDRVFGTEEVEDRFGVQVAQVRDLLALMGDSSDNVPGVPSVGPKTAKDLLNQYQTLDGIYEHLGEIKRKKLKEALTNYEEQARLSQELVTLRDDVPFEFSPAAVEYGERNLGELRAMYAELGFQRQIQALDKELAASGAAADPDAPFEPEHSALGPDLAEFKTSIITSEAQLLGLGNSIKEAESLALVPLWSGTGPVSGELVGLALAWSRQDAAYVPLAHRSLEPRPQLPATAFISWFEEICQRDDLRLVGHDLKSCLVLLQQLGSRIARCDFDTQLASYLLDPSSNHSLETLAQSKLSTSLQTMDLLLKKTKGRGKLPVAEVETEKAAEFTSVRAACVHCLDAPLTQRLEEARLLDVWKDMERPLSGLLIELEQTGVLLDVPFLKRLGNTVGEQLHALEQKAYAAAGREFNVNSPKQLEKLLFDDLGLKPLKRTKTSRSTDAETLEALSKEHPLPAVVLDVRQLSKLKGTYIDALPELVDTKTSRVHTRWRQEVAATGRLSSSDPNLQNIPIRTDLGASIREAFVAPPGKILISGDYSQIELRVLAHLSKDSVLVDAFRTGQDIHQRTAMEIFEVDAEDVDSEMRRQAKAVNFGVIYGQGDSALGKSLGIPRMEASQFIAAYFRRYSGVQRFTEETLQQARTSGLVRTLLGRQRLVTDIHHANRARRLAAERIAVNTPIQGTAADLLKLAMLKLQEPVTPSTRMLLTVHDELVFEVKQEEAELAMERIREAMESVYALDVPLVVDVGSGPNWRSAH